MTAPSFESIVRSIVRAEVSTAIRDHLEPRLQEIFRRVERIARQAADTASSEGFLSVEKAAQMVDVRPATIREWVKRRHLTRYQSGRLMRIKVSELLEFLAREADNDVPVNADAYAEQFLDDILAGSSTAPDNQEK